MKSTHTLPGALAPHLLQLSPTQSQDIRCGAPSTATRVLRRRLVSAGRKGFAMHQKFLIVMTLALAALLITVPLNAQVDVSTATLKGAVLDPFFFNDTATT